MDRSEHFTDLLLARFDVTNLQVTALLKLLFVEKGDLLITHIEIEDEYYMDKKVEKECDRQRIKENIVDRIEFKDRKYEADEKSAHCKKSYKIFTSHTFRSKIQYI